MQRLLRTTISAPDMGHYADHFAENTDEHVHDLMLIHDLLTLSCARDVGMKRGMQGSCVQTSFSQ